MSKRTYKPIEGMETHIFAREYHAQAQMHARWIRKKSYSSKTLNEIKRINEETLNDDKMKKREKDRLAKMIVNLIKTKNATIEQVKIMGKSYGVDVEEVLNSLDEQER